MTNEFDTNTHTNTDNKIKHYQFENHKLEQYRHNDNDKRDIFSNINIRFEEDRLEKEKMKQLLDNDKDNNNDNDDKQLIIKDIDIELLRTQLSIDNHTKIKPPLEDSVTEFILSSDKKTSYPSAIVDVTDYCLKNGMDNIPKELKKILVNYIEDSNKLKLLEPIIQQIIDDPNKKRLENVFKKIEHNEYPKKSTHNPSVYQRLWIRNLERDSDVYDNRFDKNNIEFTNSDIESTKETQSIIKTKPLCFQNKPLVFTEEDIQSFKNIENLPPDSLIERIKRLTKNEKKYLLKHIKIENEQDSDNYIE